MSNKPRNFVQKHMVEQHRSVAMKPKKDYDRRTDKNQLKNEIKEQ